MSAFSIIYKLFLAKETGFIQVTGWDISSLFEFIRRLSGMGIKRDWRSARAFSTHSISAMSCTESACLQTVFLDS